MSDQQKDTMFSASSFKLGQNSKGNDRLQFYLDLESSLNLAAEIVEKAKGGTGTGVQLDIHKTVGQTDQGKTIVGGIMFCKSKQPQQQRGTQNNYAPKAGGKTQEQIIAELQAQLANKQVG